MPRDTQGSYNLPTGTLVNAGDTIQPSQHNPAMSDIAQAVTGSLSRDGLGGMRADLPMGGFKATNLGAGVGSGDAVRMDQLAGIGVPIGAPMLWLTETPPANYLLAFGQAISRTTYATLFTLWGTRFGAGDGTTTFNMPDFRGLVPAGLDNMGGTAASRLPLATVVGAVIGAATVTLTTDQMPSHNHGGTTATAGAHTHQAPFLGSPVGFSIGATADTGTLGAGVTTSSAGDHSHGISAQGGGASHPNVQPTFPLNIIIRVS